MPLSQQRTPELPYLDVFYAVCAEGGFTAAADRLGCTQPAVSYQVRALERAMKTKLIERGGRRVLLTPAGERLRAFCQDFFTELARVRAEFASGHRLEPLRLGSASGFGRYVLVPALHMLRDAHKEKTLDVQVWFDSADVVLRSLERGECEAAFVYSRGVSNRLRYRGVYDEELVLIVASGKKKPWKGGGLDKLSTFEEISFVTYHESDYVFGRWFEANFGEQPSTIRSSAHFSELEEVIDFVRRGAGVSVVPRDSVEAARERGEIDIVYAGRAAPCINQVYMVVRSGSVVRREIQDLALILKRERGQIPISSFERGGASNARAFDGPANATKR
jgi:DNA-binding transcriptional LysR family regulator